MLKISSEQIKIFQPDADEAFVRRVMKYLRENHSDAEARFTNGNVSVSKIADEILNRTVRNGIERAQKHGISWKSTLMSFVVLMFIAAPNFDEYAKAALFFNQSEMIDDEKFESFLDEMTDEDWTAVEENYDKRAWNI